MRWCSLTRADLPGEIIAGSLTDEYSVCWTVGSIGDFCGGNGCREGGFGVLEDAEANYVIRADLNDLDWHYRYTPRGIVQLAKGKL